MKSIQQLFAASVIVAYCTFAMAAEDHPGYVDFSTLHGLVDAEPAVEVALREPLLRLITEMIPEEDDEAMSFVSKLLSVRMHVFNDIGDDVEQASINMNEMSAELESEGWERVVRVREDEDQVDVFLRFSPDDQIVYGIALMVVSEDGEMVLANVAGDISVNDISALGRRFGIDELAEFEQ